MLDDKDQSETILPKKCDFSEEKMDLIKRGLEDLDFLATGHHELIECLITDIFILPSERARGGSTSQAIGVIWFDPKLSYGPCDVMEMIVHELTHQLMFIDELRRPHYDYALLLKENSWPTSAILKTRRPFDKALHSAVVAMEVLLLRNNYIGHPQEPAVHPPTRILQDQLLDTINSMDEILEKNQDILMSRGHEIIENLKLNSGNLN